MKFRRGSSFLCFIFLILGLCNVLSQEVPGADIILVLDNSGSMKSNDPNSHTGAFVSDFVKNAPRNSQFAIIIFDEVARLLMPLTPVTADNINVLLAECLEQLNYRGRWTNSPAGIERALYELRLNARETSDKIIVFLTDGIVDTGDKIKDHERSSWLKDNLTADATKHGVRMFCIAFTEKADYILLQTLAQKTNGEYFRASQVEDIKQILGTVNNLVAKPEPTYPPTAPARAVPPTQVFRKGLETVEVVRTFLLDNALYSGGGLLLILILVILFILKRRNRAIFVLPAQYQKPSPAPEESKSEPRGEQWDDLLDEETPMFKERSEKPASDTDDLPSRSALVNAAGMRSKLENKPVADDDDAWDLPEKKSDTGKQAGLHKIVLPKADEYQDEPVLDKPEEQLEPVREQPPDEEKLSANKEVKETCQRPAAPGNLTRAVPKAVLEDLGNITGKATHNLDAPVIRIGRSSSLNDIIIPERTVSKQHAQVEFRDNSFFLKDLRSSNGTQLNKTSFSDNNKVTEVPLKNGDRISFDVFDFQFLVDDQEPIDQTVLRRIDLPEVDEPVRKPASSPNPQLSSTTDLSSKMLDDAVQDMENMMEEAEEEILVNSEEKDSLAETVEETEQKFETDEDIPVLNLSHCYNHPEKKGTRICGFCRYNFCDECIEKLKDGFICKDCLKMMGTQT